jgi:hypothetical protein
VDELKNLIKIEDALPIDEKENKPLEKIESHGPTKFCEICYDDHDVNQFIAGEECGHSFCLGSYKEFFEYQIK